MVDRRPHRFSGARQLSFSLRFRHTVAVFSAVCLAVCQGAALAQGTLQTPPPIFSAVDANGVDLVTGRFNYSNTDVSIGPLDAGGLAYVRSYITNGWRDNTIGTMASNGAGGYVVSVGDGSESFSLSGNEFVSDQGSGSTLTTDSGSPAIFTYTMSDGTVAVFQEFRGYIAGPHEGLGFFDSIAITSLTKPTGEHLIFHYRTGGFGSVGEHYEVTRLQSVTNNLGYHLHFDYARESATQPFDVADWRRSVAVTAINNAIDFCNPTADDCNNMSTTWPSATYSTSAGESVTDALGRTTRFTYGAGGMVAIRRPSSTSTDHVTISYASGGVSSISNGTGTWTYTYSDVGSARTTTVTDPLSKTRVVVSNFNSSRVTSDTDGEGRTVRYAYDSDDRLSSVRGPIDGADEYVLTEYEYDVRGNVIETTYIPKASSGSSPITFATTYVEEPTVTTCTNPVTCNLPATTEDGLATSPTMHTIPHMAA